MAQAMHAILLASATAATLIGRQSIRRASQSRFVPCWRDMRRTEQAWPEPGQRHRQGPVTAAQSKARRRTPQGDAELIAKEQVLGFKSARRLEEVDDKY